jgi:hypothetical protein
MIIIKCIESTHNWEVYHSSLGATKYLQFTTGTEGTNSNRWNDTAPTSTVFTVGTEPGVNQSSSNFNFVAYCFAEKKGYSKFGKYSGNEGSNGPFIYTGFKPAFFMTKCRNTGNSQDWVIKDNKRPGYNQINDVLYPNANYVEGHGADVDFLSNGIKLRSSAHNLNRGSGNEYVYMAFAENPIVGSNDIPATAE